MKFNSFDELIKYLNGVEISSFDFDIRQDCAVGAADNQEPLAPVSTQNPKAVDVIFNSLSDNQTIKFQEANESCLLVSEFEYIPNGCSTTRIRLLDRELVVKVCEENGIPTAKFDVTINGERHANKKFMLVTDAERHNNTVCLND